MYYYIKLFFLYPEEMDTSYSVMYADTLPEALEKSKKVLKDKKYLYESASIYQVNTEDDTEKLLYKFNNMMIER